MVDEVGVVEHEVDGVEEAAAAVALAPSQVLPRAPVEATTTTEATDTTRARTTTEVQDEDATTSNLAGPTLLDKATTTVLRLRPETKIILATPSRTTTTTRTFAKIVLPTKA